MPTILDKIVATKRSEIERAKAAVPEAELVRNWPMRRRCGISSRRWRRRADQADRRSEEGESFGRRDSRRFRSRGDCSDV